MAETIVTHDTSNEIVERERRFDPSGIVSLVAGIGMAVYGSIVLLDTGFGGFPDEPVVELGGFPQTPLLGAISLGLGILLLAGAIDRGISMFAGGLMIIGGLVVALGQDRLPDALATTSGFGWLVACIGALVLLVALVLPTLDRRDRIVRSTRW